MRMCYPKYRECSAFCQIKVSKRFFNRFKNAVHKNGAAAISRLCDILPPFFPTFYYFFVAYLGVGRAQTTTTTTTQKNRWTRWCSDTPLKKIAAAGRCRLCRRRRHLHFLRITCTFEYGNVPRFGYHWPSYRRRMTQIHMHSHTYTHKPARRKKKLICKTRNGNLPRRLDETPYVHISFIAKVFSLNLKRICDRCRVRRICMTCSLVFSTQQLKSFFYK